MAESGRKSSGRFSLYPLPVCGFDSSIINPKLKTGRPKKFTLPVGLEEMLRWALPKKRREDRMKIFREWARVNLTTKLWRQPTEEEFETEWNFWWHKQFNSMPFLYNTAAILKDFIPRFSAQNRKSRARIAAQKRWTKKK